MASKKLETPFGHVTQREWVGLIARGADLAHIAMFTLLRVRADRDGITRDSVPALAKQTNRSHDTVERLLGWLRDRGVISQRRTRSMKGPRGLTWLYERRALGVEEWMEYASMPPSSVDGVRTDAPSITGMEYANRGDGVRKHDLRSTQRLGDNPDGPQRKPQTQARRGSPSEGPREVGTDRLEEAEALGLIDISNTLAKSHHGPAFEDKLHELADLILRHRDRDIEQACHDLINKVDVIKYDSKAIELLESFIEKAPRVAPREPEYTADEIRARLRLPPSVEEQLAALKQRDQAALARAGIR